MNDPTMWEQILADPAARDILFPGLMVVLSIPVSALGRLLVWLPDAILPEENVPFILAGAGWVLAKVVCFKYPAIPDDIAMLIAVGSGLGSKAMKDHSWARKTQEAASGVWRPK
jgi:hypothetical protein